MATSSRLEKKEWDTTSHTECRRKRDTILFYNYQNTKKEENERQKIYREVE